MPAPSTNSASARPGDDAWRQHTPETAEIWLWSALGAVWAVLVVRLATAWSASLEQAHGWIVPVLCAWLFWERRQTAPRGDASRGMGALASLGTGLIVLAAAIPILEANRTWPTAQWFAAAGAVLVSAGLLACAGGGRWVRHFAFPLFFATTALAWPAALQVPLLQWLAQLNAAMAAETVSLAGYPAVARGNLIEVASGVVGVDEACAGLRSLQAVWMLSWFCGELFRLGMMRRFVLVGLGLGAAFLGNMVRTVFLTLRIAADGAESGERWHDTAGNVAMIATFVAVFLAAWWLARGQRPRESDALQAAVWQWSRRAGVFGTALVAVLVMEVGTRVWFAWHARAAAGVQWKLQAADDDWTPLPIAARIQDILRYSTGEGFAWRHAAGTRQAVAYALRWEDPGQLGSSGVGHDPTICMPTVGARLEAVLPHEVVRVAGRELVFSAYRFSGGGTSQHVYFCVWDAFHGRTVGERETDFFSIQRLQRVRDGRNRADAAHLVFVLQGEPSDGAAAAWLQSAAAELLHAQ